MGVDELWPYKLTLGRSKSSRSSKSSQVSLMVITLSSCLEDIIEKRYKTNNFMQLD